MSPHVNDLASSFVQMAKAYEDLPGVQQELANALKANADLLDVVQQKELRIIDLKNSLDEKLATIRSLEVARDDAEFRFLEADERTARALDFVKTTFGTAGSLIQALEPAKPEPTPEPVPEPQAVTTEPEPVKPEPYFGDHSMPYAHISPPGQSEPLPTAASPIEGSTVQMLPAGENAGSRTVEGQSATDPIPMSAGNTEAVTHHDVAQSPSVASMQPVEEKAETIHGPYFNKRYFDHQFYVR
jgi:hypothetical protein